MLTPGDLPEQYYRDDFVLRATSVYLLVPGALPADDTRQHRRESWA